MKKMDAYIIYHKKDNRPAIGVHNFGGLLIYLAKENAQAYFSTQMKEMPDYDIEYEIRRVSLSTQ